jgi:hypothetical protein
VLIALSILCNLTGIIWALQGLGILPGSFMTGQLVWAAVGAVLLFAGGLLLWFAYKPRGGNQTDRRRV